MGGAVASQDNIPTASREAGGAVPAGGRKAERFRRGDGRLIAHVLAEAAELGLQDIRPVILNNGGNLTVHLHPYPVVARVATLFPGDDPASWRTVWDTEIRVAWHLASTGIAVASPCTKVSPGPHPVGGTWMTLWDYLQPAVLPTLGPKRMVTMVDELAKAIAVVPVPLRRLGAWRNVHPALHHLEVYPENDRSIGYLLTECARIDKAVRSLAELYPAHGDAHLGNLLATTTGWRWIDFEDVSLMPRHWDFASLIGNVALFRGFSDPLVQHVFNITSSAADLESLHFAMKARLLMSTTCNLSLALRGRGDLDFARAQMDRLPECLASLDTLRQTL